MKSYLYSAKREFWEFRGAFIRLPIISVIAIAVIMIILVIAYSGNIVKFTMHENGIYIPAKSAQTANEFNLRIDLGDSDPSSPEHLSNYYEILLKTRDDLVQARSNVRITTKPGETATPTQQELAGAQQEIAKAQKKLEKAGINIEIEGLLGDVLTSDLMSEKIHGEIRREMDKEIARLDAEISATAQQLNITPPPPPQPERDAPGVPEAPVAEELQEIRKFDSTVEVIEKDESMDFTEKNIEKANDFVVVFFMFFTAVMVMVAVYYLLSCLFTDRKDNSILFWKSMPVSETQNVVIKLAIAIIVLPSIGVIAAIVVSLVYSILAMIFVATHSMMTSAWDMFAGMSIFGYALKHWLASLAIVLWSLPIFTWILFASAAAKRSPFLLAIIPPIAIGFIEKVVFDSTFFAQWLVNRMPGAQIDGMVLEYNAAGIEQVASVANVFTDVSLWLGLLISAAFVFAAIWLRNHRYEIN